MFGSETESVLEIDREEKNFVESNINNTDSFNYTPLTHAAERGHTKLVRMFLNYNALVIVKNKDNDTALILASKKGHLKIVKKLLFLEKVRECINSRGFGGNSAFLSAAKSCIGASEKKIEQRYLKILKLLADHGADVNALDDANLCAMDWAAKEGKTKLISMLLDVQAYLNDQNKTRFQVCLYCMPLNEENRELLEKIGILVEQIKIVEVELQLKNNPCFLSFKIGFEVYKCKVDDDSVNELFVEKITKLNDDICMHIGDAIVEKVIIDGAKANSIVNNFYYDKNDYRLAFQRIFALLLYEPYDFAQEHVNNEAMNKIRKIVKPIFKAFPDKHDSIYGNNLKKYGLKK